MIKKLTRLTEDFFNQDALILAKALLGKVICVKYFGTTLALPRKQGREPFVWLRARIIETEAYYLHDKASHASLGYTEKRKALFMPAGTIYMYYARGGDSLNVSAQGEGNAVLIKSGIPYNDSPEIISLMQQLNPPKNGVGVREPKKLCSGQTLLCRALNLKVKTWDQRSFTENFYIASDDYIPTRIIETTRLGIREDRDAHLNYRVIDAQYCEYCTKK